MALGNFLLGGIGEVNRSRLSNEQFNQALQQMIMQYRIKAQMEAQDPLNQMLKQGQLADAQMKIYNAGGPAPSLYGGGQQSMQMSMGQMMPQGGGMPFQMPMRQPSYSGIGPVRAPMPQQSTIPPQVAPQAAGGQMAPQMGNLAGYQAIPQGLDQFGRSTGWKFEQTPEARFRQNQQDELAKGIPSGESGKAALAEESIRNIQEVRKMLFPQGTPQSYRRDIAVQSNLPFSGLPGIPQNVGTYEPQTVARKMGAALAGRQLIQTGVAARPEETARLVRQFAPSGLMSSQAAMEGLQELEAFYSNYLQILKTRGIEAAEAWAKTNQPGGQSGQSMEAPVPGRPNFENPQPMMDPGQLQNEYQQYLKATGQR